MPRFVVDFRAKSECAIAKTLSMNGSMDDYIPASQPCHHTHEMPWRRSLLARRLARTPFCKTNVRPAIVCVGSDRVAGDSLGPLTGSSPCTGTCGADAFALRHASGGTVTARESPPLFGRVHRHRRTRAAPVHRRRRRRREPRTRRSDSSKLCTRAALSRLRCTNKQLGMHRGCEPPRHRGAAGGRLSRPRHACGYSERSMPHGVRRRRRRSFSHWRATRPALCLMSCEERPVSYADSGSMMVDTAQIV